jgi:hypothetical protein
VRFKRYGVRLIDQVDDEPVGEWLVGDKHNGTVSALRAMCQGRGLAKVGLLVCHNPLARLVISKGPGRRHEQSRSKEEQVGKLIRCARELASTSFAAGLQVAAFTGLRPGELDALRARMSISIALASLSWSKDSPSVEDSLYRRDVVRRSGYPPFPT